MTTQQVKAALSVVNAKIAKISFDENGNAIGDRHYAAELFEEKERLQDLIESLPTRPLWDKSPIYC